MRITAALATCFVNDLYREADRLAEVHGTVRGGMVVELAEVQVGSR